MNKLLAIAFISLFGSTEAYLCLDNKTVATLDQMQDDPFLVIRTKLSTFPMNFSESSLASACIQSEMPLPLPKALPICSQNKGTIKSVNGLSIYDHRKPIFDLQTLGHPDYIEWQIADNIQFESIESSLHEIAPASASIALTDIAETFLNPDQTYHFRARSLNGEWTEPLSFSVKKPETVKEVHFKKLTRDQYVLSWEPDLSKTTEYLVYASNDPDFIPDIYFDKHITSISDEMGIDFDQSSNFIQCISQPNLKIDGSYAFYRIIALDKGQLSVPSPLIYIYDNHLHPKRTILKSYDSKSAIREQIASENSNDVLLKGVQNPPHIPADIWELVKPYLLPDNHPDRKKLDRLFKKKRVVLDHETFRKSGFQFNERHNIESLVVGIHKSFPDVVVKTFLDCQLKKRDEWNNWVRRIQGAEIVREYIYTHALFDFEVPRKWIYPLPYNPSPPEDPKYYRRYFVLIAENMKIESLDRTKELYGKIKNTECLDQLFEIIEKNGLSDSAYLRNIPFTKRGTITFIDTEHYHNWPVCFNRVTPYLSSSMKKHWQSLIDNR